MPSFRVGCCMHGSFNSTDAHTSPQAHTELVLPTTFAKLQRFRFKSHHSNACTCPFCDSLELGDPAHPQMACRACGKEVRDAGGGWIEWWIDHVQTPLIRTHIHTTSIHPSIHPPMQFCYFHSSAHLGTSCIEYEQLMREGKHAL